MDEFDEFRQSAYLDRDLAKEEKARAKEESLDRQRRTREEGRIRRNIRRQEREELSRAKSASQRRQIKEAADAARDKALFDLSTEYEPSKNQTDANSDISQRGTDSTTAPDATKNLDPGQGGSDEADATLVGFAEQTLDIVQSNNTAGQKIFLTK
jgi:hypothetical protein